MYVCTNRRNNIFALNRKSNAAESSPFKQYSNVIQKEEVNKKSAIFSIAGV